MATVYKRPSDRKLGARGKWTISYVGEDGRRRRRAGFTDKAKTLALAAELEAEARRVRDGLAEPGARERRAQAARPVAAHVADYEANLLAKGGTARHARHVAGVLVRLLGDAAVAWIESLYPDRIRTALGIWRGRGRSARTCNHALGAVKALARWLVDAGRLKEVPRGLLSLKPYGEAADRRRVRRALTIEEVQRLIAAAEAGPDLHCYRRKSKHLAEPVRGADRAMLYTIALNTGFRDRELRSLTPESFRLEGEEPAIVVKAGYSKNRKEAVQPIRRELVAPLRAWLASKEPARPVFMLPWSAARMLREDLGRAGIPYETADGVADFHALRATYITRLAESGVRVKELQELARHSTPTLTLQRYCKTDAGKLRDAIEGSEKSGDVPGESPDSAGI